MPVLGDDVLPFVGAVAVMASLLALLALGVMMALKHHAGGGSTLSVGCSVKIHGLQSEKGKAHNGKTGTVTSELEGEIGRHAVMLEGGRVLAIKPGNLTLVAVPARSGAAVEDVIVLVKVCGACERKLPKDSYSGEQWALRQSNGRCEECVTGGNQLVLMKKGRKRSEEDECPICSLLLPLDPNHSIFQSCCSKLVCNGCVFRARVRGMNDCPFCRTTMPKNDASCLAMIQKRADAGDPAGISNLANQYLGGYQGLQRNVPRAVKLYERAAELGDKNAHYHLFCKCSSITRVALAHCSNSSSELTYIKVSMRGGLGSKRTPPRRFDMLKKLQCSATMLPDTTLVPWNTRTETTKSLCST